MAVREADLVLSSLADRKAVRDVYLSVDGAVEGASSQLFIEMSTAGPDILLELDNALRARGSRLIDAPIFGNQLAVEAGTALLLVGGDEGDIAQAADVLRLLGEIRRIGPLGAGARLKLVASSMLATTHVVAAELFDAGLALGLDPETVFWALTLQAPYLASRRARYLENAHGTPLFSLADMLKDVDLAIDAYAGVHASAPVTRLVCQIIQEAIPTVGALDLSALITRYTH